MNRKENKTSECEVCGAKVAKGKRFCEVCAPSDSFDLPEAMSTPKEPENVLPEEAKQKIKTNEISKIENLGDANGIADYKQDSEETEVPNSLDPDFESFQEPEEQNL